MKSIIFSLMFSLCCVQGWAGLGDELDTQRLARLCGRSVLATPAAPRDPAFSSVCIVWRQLQELQARVAKLEEKRNEAPRYGDPGVSGC